MDKNIAALMREDSFTVHVSFNVGGKPNEFGSSDKLYTYVTNLSVFIADLVVVEANGRFTLAMVKQVDGNVDIEPNSAIAYKWVVATVSLKHYVENALRNKAITDAVSVAYKHNLRHSFSQQVLLGMPEDKRLDLEKLVKGR